MITDEDTTKIVNKVIEANKQLFYTKDEVDGGLDKRFESLRKDFSNLQASVVSFAKGTKNNADEILVVNSRVTTAEIWIKQAAPKIGLEFKP
jgi:hypothetical protein